MSCERHNLPVIKTKIKKKRQKKKSVNLIFYRPSSARGLNAVKPLLISHIHCMFQKGKVEHQWTQNQEPWGYLVQPASCSYQQSRSDLRVGRERGKGEVEKGLWTDACSAMYSFAPESGAYLQKPSHRRKLLFASWELNQQRLLRKIWKFFFLSKSGKESPETLTLLNYHCFLGTFSSWNKCGTQQFLGEGQGLLAQHRSSG